VIDEAEGLRRISNAATSADLSHSGISGLADVYGAVMQDDRELRALVRGVSPVTDDRPSIQYPFETIAAWPNYARLFRHAPSKPGALLSREPEPAMRAQIDQVALALSQVLPTLHLSETGSVERRELVTGNAVRSALAARPNDEALLALLSLHFERVRLAADVFRRPDSIELLKNGPDAAFASGRIAAYQAAYDAAWTLARRAFYTGDYARALDILASFTPRPDEASRHALLRAGCLRALGREAQSVVALESAAQASHDRVFQSAMRKLVAQSKQPFAPERGPLASR
jgi:tetratricopeptide (TPR) repeat protein